MSMTMRFYSYYNNLSDSLFGVDTCSPYRFVHLLYWLFGFPTVIYLEHEVKLGGPKEIFYPIIAIILTIASRIERMITDNFLLSVKDIHAPTVIYLSLKTLETVSAVWALISESLMNKNEKLKLHQNLRRIDTILRVGRDEYKHALSKSTLSYLFYTVCTFLYYSLDFFTWKKGLAQVFLSAKMITFDLIVLQYCQEIYLCLLRLEVLNSYLWYYSRGHHVQMVAGVDYRRQSLFPSKRYDKLIRETSKVTEQSRVINIMKAYSTLAENVNIMGNRISNNVGVVSIQAFLTCITVANIFARKAKYPDTDDEWANFSLFLWWMHYIMYFVCATGITEILVKEAERTRDLLGKLSVTFIKDKEISKVLSKCVTLVLKRELRVSIWRLYPMDLSLLFNFVALTASYSVILIQMN